MSNQCRLLSDEELREEFADIMADYDRSRVSPTGDAVDIEVNTSNRLIELFNTQKRLYAESVIGEDNPEDYEVAFSRIIQSDSTVGISQIDRQKCYNELRAEQRARIK